MLGRHGLGCVGGFVPVVLHDADHDPVLDVAGPLDALVAAGAGVLVLAAATGADGYDSRPHSTTTSGPRCWPTWTGSPPSPPSAVSLAVLHPHVGTMVETRAEVDRVLAGSSIPLCLDTGHLLIGGHRPAGVGPGGAAPRRPRPPQGCRRRRWPPGCSPAS